MKRIGLASLILALIVVGLSAGNYSFAGEDHGCMCVEKHDKKHDHKHEKKSTVAKVGEPAPQFTITDTEGNKVSLAELTEAEKVVVLEFFNPQCPYVVKHYKKSSTMNDMAAKYQDQGVVWLAVSANPKDADWNKKYVKEWKIKHPVLVDTDGEISAMYDAKTTPHMYIIDKEGELAYAGAIDNSRNAAAPKTDSDDYVNYVEKALDELLAGKEVSMPETKSYGCSIKSKKKKKS
jgi:peroxiredoxin